MEKREAKFTTKFQKWLAKNWDQTGPIEVKVSNNHRIAFAQFPEHQIRALRMAKHNKVVWKIPDLGRTNPFDLILYCKSGAWVCLVFFVDTDQEVFYILDIDVWIAEEIKCSEKSITEARAKEIGQTCDLS